MTQAATDVLGVAREQVLERGEGLDQGQVLEVLQLPDDRLEELLALAHDVRMRWCGPEVEVEGIISLKTGGCPEDCHFCSQSAKFETTVAATPFLDRDEILQAARETAELGASEFCIVLAVRGPDERTIQRILELVPEINAETGLDVAVSAGILEADQARRLAEGGVHRYNHNLETAESFFGEIVTTHTWQERWDTCQLVKDNRMELCCGVLLGMGETDAQRLELIGQLAQLEPQEVPINFLNPRPGTPLALKALTPAKEALKWIALFRLGLPDVILRSAGGREITLGDLQAAGMTSGLNALIVGNYLTTLGRSPSEDLDMLADLEMPIGSLSKVL